MMAEDILLEPFRRVRPLLKREINIIEQKLPELKKLAKRLEKGEKPKIVDVFGTKFLFPEEKDIKKRINILEWRLPKLKKRLKDMM